MFKPINTQEEFDTAISDRLKRETAKFADYEDLKREAKNAAELQKQLDAASAKINTLEQAAKEASGYAERAEKAERALLRLKIAGETHLPAPLAERLNGETEAELRKDAAALAAFVSVPTPPLATTEPSANFQTDPMDAAIAALSEQMKGAT